MDDQYLWDRTGTPDVEVARLEEVLARMRYLPEEAPWLAEPVALAERSRMHWLWLAGGAALAAAVVLVLLRQGEETPVDTTPVVEAPVAETPAAIEEPEPPAPREAIADERESEETGTIEGGEEPEVQEEEKRHRLPPKSRRRKLTRDDGRERHAAQPKCRPLSEKLDIEQVKAGFAAVEKGAQACGKKHGAKPGTKVKIKVKIEGRTGKVVSSEATGPHVDTALGQCVADVGLRARFPCFKKKWIGVVYPFVM
jgi:hypothetical protein